MKKFLALLSIVSFLTACTPTFNFSLPEVAPAHHKMNADLKDVVIVPDEPGSVQPAMVIHSTELLKGDDQELIPAWGLALRDAVDRSKVFDKWAKKKVSLYLTIHEVDVPCMAIDFTTKVSATYKLVDNGTDATLFSDTVKTEATVPSSYAFRGYVRAVESITRAVKKNIETFLSHLKNYKPL